MPVATNCNLCNYANYKILYEESSLLDLDGLRNLLNISCELYCVRCMNCGLVYLNPMPTFEDWRRYYEKDYDFILHRDRQSYLKGAEGIKNELLQYEKYVKRGKLLDIGCGTGNFIYRAKELGWNAYGIEISKRYTDFLRNEIGLNVMSVPVEEAEFNPNFFDVVVLNHVLEHLFDPKHVLKKIHGFLRKGGIVAIYIPNELESLYSKLRLDNLLFYFQPRERPTDHLYFFNKRTIQLLLIRTGYKVIDVTTGNFRININHKNRYGLVGDLGKKVYCTIADLLKMGDLINIIAQKV